MLKYNIILIRYIIIIYSKLLFMFYINKFIFGFLLCNLFIASTVFAKQGDTLVIARGNHSYPPYEIMSAEQALTGLHIEIIAAIAKQLDLKIEFKSVPWKRALYMIKHGKADAISYISKTKERQAFAIFHEENILSYGNYVFFALNEDRHAIHFTGELEQLKPYSIGTIMGYHYSPKLEEATYLKVDNQSKSEDILLERLRRKHFNIGLADKDQMTLLARQKGISEKMMYLSPALFTSPQYIAFSRIKNHDVLAKEFAQALQAFKKTSAYQDLLAKYTIENQLF